MQARAEQTTDSRLCHDALVTVATTAAAILAGGRARRFRGLDKSRLVVDGHTIIVRQMDVLQRVAAEVFVVGADPARFSDLGVAVHPDRLPELGTIGGLYTALDVATREHVLAVACDQPFLDARLLQALVERAAGHDGAWVSTSRGVEPLLACYRRDARAKVRAAIDNGRRRARDLQSVLDMAEIDETELAAFGSVADLLTNLNTPDDYARVQYRRP
jgi:molybdopterin-guanine dinucleotide biosynthesis protein A